MRRRRSVLAAYNRHQRAATADAGFDSLSSISATTGLTTFNQKITGHPLTKMTGGIYGKGFEYGNEMKQNLGNTSFNGSIDYQRFFNKERTN